MTFQEWYDENKHRMYFQMPTTEMETVITDDKWAKHIWEAAQEILAAELHPDIVKLQEEVLKLKTESENKIDPDRGGMHSTCRHPLDMD